MTWTSLTFAYASVLTSTKMTQMQDNFAALAAGDAGSPALTRVHFVGTTSIAGNRSSAAQTLTGVSIDGNAGGSSSSCTGSSSSCTGAAASNVLKDINAAFGVGSTVIATIGWDGSLVVASLGTCAGSRMHVPLQDYGTDVTAALPGTWRNLSGVQISGDTILGYGFFQRIA